MLELWFRRFVDGGRAERLADTSTLAEAV
jgi:hypothetical protein